MSTNRRSSVSPLSFSFHLSFLFLFLLVGLSACSENFEKYPEDPRGLVFDDMILDQEFIGPHDGPHVLMEDQGEVSEQAASGFTEYYSQTWANGVIPVVFDKAVPSTKQTLFLLWGNKWNDGTGVKLIKRTKETSYLTVTYQDNGCYSHVGYRRGEERNLNLAPGCWYEATVQHEIGHAFGLMHEHQRPDRDSYIKIDLSSVPLSIRYAFDRFRTMDDYEPYDFLSVMHYGPTAFSSNGSRTISVQPLYAKYQNQIGINGISAGDRRVLAKMYRREVER